MAQARTFSRNEPRLYGREDTVNALCGAARLAREGAGTAVVVTGDRGGGKTALLDRLEAETGLRTVDLTGVRAERGLPLAGLARLAASAGFAAVGEAADEASACHALHRRVERHCAEGPLLFRVDDADLLDRASARALVSLGHRSGALPLLLVLTVSTDALGRELTPVIPREFTRYPLTPLDELDSRLLLRDRARVTPAPEVVEDVLVRCGGNPLALGELAEALTVERAAGLEPPALPPDGRLLGQARQLLHEIPEEARRLATLVIAGGRLDTRVLHRAAGADATGTAWSELLATGLVGVSGKSAWFSGELVRSALEGEWDPAEMCAAHARLAAAFAEEGQTARALEHRCAAGGPLPVPVGDGLAEAASEAARDGDHGLSSRLHEWAALLEPDREASASGLLAAGVHAWTSGNPQRALSLARRARPLARTTGSLVGNELLRGGVELCAGSPDAARRSFTAAGRALVTTDRNAAVRALMFAGEASCLAGDYRSYYELADRAALLRSADDTPETALMFEHFAGISATFRGEHVRAVPALRKVVHLAESTTDSDSALWGSQAAFTLGLPHQARDLALGARHEERRRDEGSQEPWACVYVSLAALLLDRHAEAETASLEGLRSARAHGQWNRAVDHLVLLALVAALRGDLETVGVRLDQAFARDLSGEGLGRPDAFGNWGAACAELAHDKPAEAARRLRLIGSDSGGCNPVVRVMAAPYFVEAAVSCGEHDSARRLLRAFDRWVGPTGSPARLALSHRCHALLAEHPSEAEERFRAAIELHRDSGSTLELARTELLYASRLRRARRPREAGRLLDEALGVFRYHRARGWTEKARAELRATGRSVPSDGVREHPGLTGQQARVSELVVEGATNREIAQRLCLSERTVEHHLRNVFVRLGVRSRVELARMLG
ncbi:helix-turn-helix transcriptional regulator [Actinopolyspora mortivallis]|uniref:Helix-turn-helix transcriptional regulator n=1 Tax=Actinopolyspora mortivallis TaxID=33906 RepID=A0A2T0GYJ9_ACTMO|nr:LuxR family transcriptional regulator [Actinopolyspora mortivallis]PRW64186.1 helix-turn-helix transcriptional regulator [Actinopolyspora mortivallis]